MAMIRNRIAKKNISLGDLDLHLQLLNYAIVDFGIEIVNESNCDLNNFKELVETYKTLLLLTGEVR